MQLALTRLINFYRDEHYFRQLARLIWPLALQNLINSSLNMVNTLMIGQNGETAMAAVALAGQVFFLLNLLLFGLGSGSAMFTAQLWGKKDIVNIRKVLGLCITLAVGAALFFFAVSQLVPEWVLSIYSTDPEVIRLGASYLRIFSWTYIFFAILFSYAIILRSIGEVKAPVTISIISLLINAALAYALIFGKLGLPKLGINGAAWATVISRVLECVALIYYTYKHSGSPAAAKLNELFGFDRAFFINVMKPVLPVTVNEILWSVGITTYSAIYARMGTESIAAINIVGTIDMVAFILVWAMNGANSVLVGNAIGAGDEEAAQKYAGRSLLLVVVGAGIMGALAYFSSGLVLSLYKVSPQVIENTWHILAFSCGLFWLRAMNGFLLVAIMRSGGDTQFALILDGIIIWIVGVPLAALGAFVFHWPVEYVFLCAMSEEATKGVLGVWRFFSRKWIHNLTRAVE